MARKRLKRKDIKKPDEFVTLSRQALAWSAEHARIAAWAGGGLLLVLATIGTIAAVRSSRIGEANANLGQAMAALRADDKSAAVAELRQVSERWAGSQVSVLAAILAANTEVSLGNADPAISQFDAVQTETSRLPSYLKQEVVYGLAAALEVKGDIPAATTKYAEASSLGGPYTAIAILSEARLRDQAGETDRAAELYRKAYEEFPELPGRELVADRLTPS